MKKTPKKIKTEPTPQELDAAQEAAEAAIAQEAMIDLLFGIVVLSVLPDQKENYSLENE